jgi:hypothetical protein
MKYIMALLCALLFIKAKAQQNYDASLIPKELKPYASAVIRNMELSTEVKDLNNTIYHVKQAVTILNKNGDDNADVVVWHNKSNQIRYIKGIVYNEAGKPVGKFSERDFQDVSAGSSTSMFEDSRVKHFQPAVIDYPYTVEYEYEVRSKQSLNFRDWRPVPSAGTAVEQSTYQFICKPDFNIRYKEINYPGKVATGIDKAGSKTYTWQVKGLKSIKDEPYSPNPEQFLTYVKVAPEKFAYEGYTGSFNNWSELGKWTYDKLLKTRTQLLPETVTRIKELTKDLTNPKLKAKKIYEYMQQKTRYISVQVGIGGFQPMLATEVDRLSYGDCKALVNYTQALLKAADIDAYYCVVESGSRKVSLMPDFASMNQGDHVILCLPLKNDTTWLECTNQQIPFGFLGDFTDDRYVLACLPTGGKLLHTPKYTAQANRQTRKGTFTIDNTGELAGSMTTTFEGAQYDNREELIGEPYTEQVKSLQDIYPVNNMEIRKFELKQHKAIAPVVTETIALKARDYATLNTDGLYFSINPVNRVARAPKEVRNRTSNVYINRGYTDEDELTYNIPQGYRADKLPLSVSIEKPFGKFTATMTLSDGQLHYKRYLQVIDGTYSKESYEELVSFYQKITDADHYNVALVKK